MIFSGGHELPILTEGDERLLATSSPVSTLDASARHDAAAAVATLAAFRSRHGFGRALAAPQVGIARRILAIDLGAGPFVVFNPEIVFRSGELFEVWDDCFSVPDKLVRVSRHVSISLVYRDDAFRERRWERLPPDLAELLQHEIDHLDGILMTMRASGPEAVRPAAERAALVDAARPRRRLSLERIADAAREIDPVFLGSPQFPSAPLSEVFGADVTLKVETLNPIRSFKGRGADFLLARRAARGDLSPIVCASAGNFGQAMAFACARRGVPLVVYAAVSAVPMKVARMRALGAEVRLEGEDFDAAVDAARSFAASSGASLVVDGAEPEITEGAGTIAVELLARGDAFDDVLVPLGDGALVNGIGRFAKAASPATRIVAVAAEGAPALAESWARGDLVTHPRTDTIADGIAVRLPVPEALADMRGLVDEALLVSDAHIVEAMRLAHRHAGLVLEPAGAAGLAALVAHRERFQRRRVAVVLTGANVEEETFLRWIAG